MDSRSGNAYLVSATLHGAVVAVAIFFTFIFQSSPPETPKIMELVAGAGDNYGATEAPALGEPDAIKAPLQATSVTPPAPEDAPVQPAAVVEVEPAPKPASKPTPKTPSKNATPPDFTRVVQHAEIHRELNLELKRKRAEAAEERLRKLEAARAAAAQKVARVDTEGIHEGVAGGSTANKEGGAGGTAMTREEGSLLDAYWAELKLRLSESLDDVKPTDVSDTLSARVSFYVAADGSISRVHIIHSSGNGEFDSAVMEAFRNARGIGPRPDHRGDEHETTMRMREDDSGQ